MRDYNPDKPSIYIQYLDANNLYGAQCHNHFQHMVLDGKKI